MQNELELRAILERQILNAKAKDKPELHNLEIKKSSGAKKRTPRTETSISTQRQVEHNAQVQGQVNVGLTIEQEILFSSDLASFVPMEQYFIESTRRTTDENYDDYVEKSSKIILAVTGNTQANVKTEPIYKYPHYNYKEKQEILFSQAAFNRISSRKDGNYTSRLIQKDEFNKFLGGFDYANPPVGFIVAQIDGKTYVDYNPKNYRITNPLKIDPDNNSNDDVNNLRPEALLIAAKFTPQELNWFLLLAEKHKESQPDNFDFMQLVRAFDYFLSQLKELEPVGTLTLPPIEELNFDASATYSLQTFCSRVLTLLKNVRAEDRQEQLAQINKGLDLSVHGIPFVLWFKPENYNFFHPSMHIGQNQEYPYMVPTITRRDDGIPKLVYKNDRHSPETKVDIAEAFYRYVASYSKSLPLEFYEKVFGLVNDAGFSNDAKYCLLRIFVSATVNDNANIDMHYALKKVEDIIDIIQTDATGPLKKLYEDWTAQLLHNFDSAPLEFLERVARIHTNTWHVTRVGRNVRGEQRIEGLNFNVRNTGKSYYAGMQYYTDNELETLCVPITVAAPTTYDLSNTALSNAYNEIVKKVMSYLPTEYEMPNLYPGKEEDYTKNGAPVIAMQNSLIALISLFNIRQENVEEIINEYAHSNLQWKPFIPNDIENQNTRDYVWLLTNVFSTLALVKNPAKLRADLTPTVLQNLIQSIKIAIIRRGHKLSRVELLNIAKTCIDNTPILKENLDKDTLERFAQGKASPICCKIIKDYFPPSLHGNLESLFNKLNLLDIEQGLNIEILTQLDRIVKTLDNNIEANHLISALYSSKSLYQNLNGQELLDFLNKDLRYPSQIYNFINLLNADNNNRYPVEKFLEKAKLYDAEISRLQRDGIALYRWSGESLLQTCIFNDYIKHYDFMLVIGKFLEHKPELAKHVVKFFKTKLGQAFLEEEEAVNITAQLSHMPQNLQLLLLEYFCAHDDDAAGLNVDVTEKILAAIVKNLDKRQIIAYYIPQCTTLETDIDIIIEKAQFLSPYGPYPELEKLKGMDQAGYETWLEENTKHIEFDTDKAYEQLSKFIIDGKSINEKDIDDLITSLKKAFDNFARPDCSTEGLVRAYKDHIFTENKLDPHTLVALICELEGRISGTPMNTTQVLAAYYASITNSSMSEVATGEGKSKITRVVAAYRVANTNGIVDILTSNNTLAERDYLASIEFWQALGVNCSLIQAQSKLESYADRGPSVHYSTSSDIGLFNNRKLHAGNKEENKAPKIAIIDEIDASIYDNTMAFNLSVPDTTNNRVYKALLEYVKSTRESASGEIVPLTLFNEDPAIFVNNKAQFTQDFLSFIAQNFHELHAEIVDLSHTQPDKIATWLQSSCIALSLEYNKDYKISTGVVQQGSKLLQSSVIVVLTPEGHIAEGAQFSDGVQQALAYILEEERSKVRAGKVPKSPLEYTLRDQQKPFYVPDESSIAVTSNQSLLLQGYNDVVGLTGSVGEKHLQAEFKEYYDNASIISVPRDEPLQRLDIGCHLLANDEQKYKAIKQEIKNAKRNNRPCLIIYKDEKEAQEACKRLQESGEDINFISAEDSKDNAIMQEKLQNAGKAGVITISSPIVGRGTDITVNKDAGLAGLHVVVAYLPDDRTYMQNIGRAGRFGKKGSSIMVVSKADIEAVTKEPLPKEFYLEPDYTLSILWAKIDKLEQRMRILDQNIMGKIASQANFDHIEPIADRNNIRAAYIKYASNIKEKYLAQLREICNSANPDLGYINDILSSYADELKKFNVHGAGDVTAQIKFDPIEENSQLGRLLTKPIWVSYHHKVHSQYHPSHDGKNVRYEHWWIPVVASIKGWLNLVPGVNLQNARVPFANTRAAWNNRGVIFADFRAWLYRRRTLKHANNDANILKASTPQGVEPQVESRRGSTADITQELDAVNSTSRMAKKIKADNTKSKAPKGSYVTAGKPKVESERPENPNNNPGAPGPH